MSQRTFLPNRKYLMKQWLIWTGLALAALAVATLLSVIVGLNEGGGAALVLLGIAGTLDLIFWIGAMVLSGPYFRSLRYEIYQDEVIVHVGILTHSVKHVPYRTVTNITVQRDILDRWFFGLGTLTIQTAGMSGQTGAEESLVGLDNVQEVYEIVARELRRFRAAMSPVGTDGADLPAGSQDETLAALLGEVRAIRQQLAPAQDGT